MEKVERQSNFEFMRILSMLMIVMWHVLVHGKILEGIGEPYAFLSNVIKAILIVHVNSLVFLTGYFNGSKKETSLTKVFKLLGESWFYKVLIVIILFLTGKMVFTKVNLMEEFFPINIKGYWFLNIYIVLILLSPYLNKVVQKMNEKEYLKFLGIQFLLFSIIPFITAGKFFFNDGYSITNFIMMYYVGYYFKKYPIKEKIKNLSDKKWLSILISSFFLIAFIRLGIYYLGEKMSLTNSSVIDFWGNVMKTSFLYYSSPLTILQTCCYCLFFERIKIKSKMINYIASTTFGIYLIHDNDNIRSIIYNELQVARFGASKKALLMLVGVTLLIFIGSFLIDSIRKLLVKIMTRVFKKKKK